MIANFAGTDAHERALQFVENRMKAGDVLKCLHIFTGPQVEVQMKPRDEYLLDALKVREVPLTRRQKVALLMADDIENNRFQSRTR